MRRPVLPTDQPKPQFRVIQLPYGKPQLMPPCQRIQIRVPRREQDA